MSAAAPAEHPGQPAHPMPRRVVDGIVAETLNRRVWCLAERSLKASGSLAQLADVLIQRGRQVALLSAGNDQAAQTALGLPQVKSIREACARFAVSSADIVLVTADPENDAQIFPAQGARQIAVGVQQWARRNTITLNDADDLDGMFDQTAVYRSRSTYHEV